MRSRSFFRRPWSVGIAVLIGILLVAGAVFFWRSLPPDPQILVDAGQALERRPEEALRLANRYLAKVPQSAAARYVAAQAAEKLGRQDEALELLRGVPAEDSSAEAVESGLLAGKLHVARGEAWKAEQQYRRVLSHRPDDVTANRQMVFLLTVEGRRWESRPYLLSLVTQQQNTVEELIVLGDLWPDYASKAELERFRRDQPHDPLPLLGLARLAAHRNEFAEARQMLEQVIKAYPDLVEARAWLGWTLVQEPAGAGELGAWEKSLPAGADDHPMIWLVRGMGAEKLGQRNAAIRCFWEALLRDPNFELAAYQLSRTLAATDQKEPARIVQRRTDALYELAAILKRVHSDRNNLAKLPGGMEMLRKIAEGLESLGRPREAWAWYHLIAAVDPSQAWASGEAERLGKMAERPYLSLKDAEPDLVLDPSQEPLPRWPTAGTTAAASANSDSASPVRFSDSAAAAGVDFTYFNGDEPDNARLLGTTGGGVAVLDYDGDNWPDIFFTQGCVWPVNPADTTHRDKLYRNLGNGRFEDVTLATGLGDNLYSQGVAVGDFNNDGCPDLYLANLGVNKLYQNNGDGTFTDISSQAGITGDGWSTSCLVADLSGDGLPDLYDVTYVEGDALTRRCGIGPCPPHVFPAADDRLLLNWGDGTFRDVTRAAGITGKNGKGLGIVAADFAASGRLSLFVANDGTPNFFYDNVTPPGEPIPRFAENGVLSGLAFDRAGAFQACMGVAADDATGDGFIELFVTNFYNESNTLYVPEVSGKLYSDQTAEFGLRDGSLRMLGFGTQFIDGELDGWPDLILTNGHVQDHSKEGIPFAMRAQYYRNLQGTGFEEVAAESLGPFFEQLRLGRGLARLDWNRDGREDAVISHIASPAALLTNETSPTGHFLALQLRGTVGSRDAIGTIVRLQSGGRTITRQLTAGDGYQASNQRQLIFGLGSTERIEQMEIQWPGGGKQTFSDLALDAEYIALEGRDSLVKLMRQAPP